MNALYKINIKSCFLWIASASCALFAITVCVQAADPIGSRFNYTENKELSKTYSENKNTQLLASQFGLTQEEWRRYEDIMQGEGQFRLNGVDPVWVLGTLARNSEERKRYSELAAKNEEKYTEQTLAFQKAFLEARNRLYGGNAYSENKVIFPNEFKPGDRLLYFLESNCKTCESSTREIISLVQKYRIGCDIYFLKTQSKDSILQTWARSYRIPAELVTSRLVTLNHERGEFARLGLNESLPIILLRRNNSVMKVLVDKL